MRYLVTGGTGFIGRALVPRLLQLGNVVLLVREEYGSGRPLPAPLSLLRSEFDVVYADLRSFQLTSRALRSAAPDIVIHLAAAGVTDPFLNVQSALSHNVTGTINLLRASFESVGTVKRLITARTPGEATAMNTYAASKASAWSFCQMYARTAGWPITGATIFQSYGPGQPAHLLVPSAINAAVRGETFPLSNGRQAKDWIYVDDAVDGLLATVNSTLQPGATVELGTGRAVPVLEVVNTIYELAGQGGHPLPGVLPNRPGEELHQAADADATAKAIGWRSRIDLATGLERTIAAVHAA